jgi:hypothetical protein
LEIEHETEAHCIFFRRVVARHGSERARADWYGKRSDQAELLAFDRSSKQREWQFFAALADSERGDD